MVRSSVLVCALVAAALLLMAAPGAESRVTCVTVASTMGKCMSYIRGRGPLTNDCCGGVKSLAASAKSTTDRQTACNCLKSLATKIPGIKYDLVEGVPGKCHVSVPYAISPSTDCSKVR